MCTLQVIYNTKKDGLWSAHHQLPTWYNGGFQLTGSLEAWVSKHPQLLRHRG